MSDESVREGIERAYSHAAWIAQNVAAEIGCAMTLPHVLMRPRIFVDGNKWCALYGDNLQDGVAGFGDSPADAMHRFDEEWEAKLCIKYKPAEKTEEKGAKP